MGILCLDPTSDLCAVLAYTTSRDVVDALGGSIDGEKFESVTDGFFYCMVGLEWDDSDTDASEDEAERAWKACVDACEAAGVEWTEV